MSFASLDRPEIASPPEDYAESYGETTCDPTPKPGVEMFAKYVMSRLGGTDVGIPRACPGPGGRPRSGHYSGRAWDWGMRTDNPDEMSRVDKFFAWLMANDNEVARRAGLLYAIWNRELWSPRRGTFETYTGPDPHTGHVHVSFSENGAAGLTSLYPWLETQLSGNVPVPDPVPVIRTKKQHSTWDNVPAGIASFAVAAAVAYTIATRASLRSGRSV